MAMGKSVAVGKWVAALILASALTVSKRLRACSVAKNAVAAGCSTARGDVAAESTAGRQIKSRVPTATRLYQGEKEKLFKRI
jgi:hypothetical protein